MSLLLSCGDYIQGVSESVVVLKKSKVSNFCNRHLYYFSLEFQFDGQLLWGQYKGEVVIECDCVDLDTFAINTHKLGPKVC